VRRIPTTWAGASRLGRRGALPQPRLFLQDKSPAEVFDCRLLDCDPAGNNVRLNAPSTKFGVAQKCANDLPLFLDTSLSHCSAALLSGENMKIGRADATVALGPATI
jgi:hypothetical protein